MNNYAGHRLSPWLGHLMMVSRQETSRPLLTPGEVMQLPPRDQLILVSGIPPIRAQKVRYYEDKRLTSRILDPPALTTPAVDVSPKPTTGQRCPTCTQTRRQRARRPPALWAMKIRPMRASAVSPPYQSMRRWCPRSQLVGQYSRCSTRI
jgi:type IV secretory pathway TraG/TraD family ATPase VirD4